jgi:HSP20 family protein
MAETVGHVSGTCLAPTVRWFDSLRFTHSSSIPPRRFDRRSEDTMTTTVLEKKPTTLHNDEDPVAEFELFEPGLVGNLLADMRFAEEIDRFFAGIGVRRRGFLPTLFRTPLAAPWTPSIEMFYANEAIVVRAELPGLNKEEVKVEIVKGALTIEGERKYEKEATKRGYLTTELAYGTFYRRLPLPEEAMVGEAKAAFKNGVLEVTIPAPALEKEVARQLEIKVV